MSSFLANIPPSRPSTRSSAKIESRKSTPLIERLGYYKETRPIKSASTSLPTVQPSESVKLKLDVSTKNNKKIKSDPSFVPRPPREERIRWRETPKKKQTPPEQIKRRPSHIIKKKKSAILDDYEFVRAEDTPVPEPIQEEVVLETPKLPSPPKTPTPPPKTPAESPALPKIVISLKNLWGPKQKDRSYWDELRRMREAEERRKQLLIRQRLNRRRPGDVMDLSGGPEIQEELEMPEDPDGWLAKYCIFNRDDLEMFKCAFEAVDENNTGYLDGFDISIAIRGVNPKLTGFEEEYIYRILEMVGYNIEMGSGADFKLFAVMAAMSQRIAALDDWMRGLIGKINFKSLEHKMYMCKTLWECNVDHDTNRISIDQLCVELRAGGVSLKHEHEVREKLGHLKSLDLMDFLTYMPLFLMIHKSVTANPLDDSRIK
ncbi:unnamed protein product [Owenia fusiformis]|nr:unnamed protein product [Owenia fusiformis]